jgi:ribosomal protein L7/L12
VGAVHQARAGGVGIQLLEASRTMSHTITYNAEERIIEIKVQGDFSLSEAKEMCTEAVQVVKAQNCFLVLTDMREAIVNLSILEIYELPKTLRDMFASSGLSVYKVKQALVITKDSKEHSFFETVTLNRSQSIRYFFDTDEARQWLS